MQKKGLLVILLIIIINLNLFLTYTIIFYGTSKGSFQRYTGATQQGLLSICIDQDLQLINNPLTARAESRFVYDINITNEAAYPTLNFSDNTSLFNIDGPTGIINFTPSEANVGTHYIGIFVGNLACQDPDDEMILNLTINTTNTAPSIDLPEIFNLTEDVPFIYNMSIFASDPEENHLKFFDNTQLFVVGEDTGMVAFTPVNSQVGQHTVRISVVDTGFLTDFDDTIFNITNVNDPPNLTLIGARTQYFNFTFNITLEGIDVDIGDNLTFSSNTSWFLNASATIPTSSQAATIELSFNITDFNRFNGTHYINVTVNDTLGAEDSEVFSITFLRFNHPPNITSFQPLNATVNQRTAVTFTITKEDVDGTTPTVLWYINGDLQAGQNADAFVFDTTGYTGINNISVIVTDGMANDSASGLVTVIVPPPANEKLETAPSFGGGGLRLFCDEIWVCTDWSECPKAEIQIRDCSDIKKCGSLKTKPNLTQPCAYVDIPSCSDKVRNQGEVLPDCGGPCKPCPTCDDGIRNHNENEVDCGGPCKPCREIRQPAKPEQLTAQQLTTRRFWWFWLLVLLTIMALIFALRHYIASLAKSAKSSLYLTQVNRLIAASQKAIAEGDYKKATKLYEEANSIYKKMPKGLKAKVKLQKPH